jgi:hypothetical protein
MVPPTKTEQDDGKVIDASGRFGGVDPGSRPAPADEPEVSAPRQLAAQLMVPAREPVKQTQEERQDDYFAGLLDDRREPNQPAGQRTAASASSKHRELDQFFKHAIQAPLRPTPAQPRAAGSASLEPHAINHHTNRRHVSLRCIGAVGTAALALSGLLITTTMWSPHDHPGESAGLAQPPTRVSFLDPVVSKTENAATEITDVSFRHPRQAIRHRHIQRHRPRHATASAPVQSTSVAHATSVPVSSTSTESTASQQSSTAATETPSTQASTIATAGTTTTKPSTSTAKRPAFGQAGVLGPGHSPDS